MNHSENTHIKINELEKSNLKINHLEKNTHEKMYELFKKKLKTQIKINESFFF